MPILSQEIVSELLTIEFEMWQPQKDANAKHPAATVAHAILQSMRTSLACLATLLAVVFYGYIAVGWGATIWEQGLEAALTEHTTQPSLPVTVAGLVLGTAFLCIGVSCFGRSRGG